PLGPLARPYHPNKEGAGQEEHQRDSDGHSPENTLEVRSGSAGASQSYWHGQKARVVDVENIQFPVSPAARAWEAQSLRAGESPSTLLRYESQAGASLVPSSESLYWRLCSWDTTRIAVRSVSRTDISTRLPVRLALLREGARSLDGVLGPPHPLRFRVTELERDVQGMAEAHERRLLARPDGQGRALQDLVVPLERSGHDLGSGHDLFDHAEPVRLLGRHVTAGEDVAHGDLLRDHAGQAMHAARSRHQAHAGLG